MIMNSFRSFLDYMRNHGYEIKIAFKDESFLMKLLGLLLFFTKSFMTKFTTTLNNTVYFPSREWLEKNEHAATRILAHEVLHIHDRKKLNKRGTVILYPFLYLFPQILAVFSLLAFLAFVNINWLFCLLFLLCLAPIPAPGRFYLESRGYTMNMFIRSLDAAYGHYWYNAEVHAHVIADYFTGPFYYYMWPFHDHVVKTLLDNHSKALFVSPVFRDVQLWFQNEHLD